MFLNTCSFSRVVFVDLLTLQNCRVSGQKGKLLLWPVHTSASSVLASVLLSDCSCLGVSSQASCHGRQVLCMAQDFINTRA